MPEKAPETAVASSNSRAFVAVDVETANADRSSICQIGAVRVEDGAITESWESLIDPETYFDEWNVSIHHITPEMVRGKPRFADVQAHLAGFVASYTVVSHMGFDRVAIERAHARYGLEAPCWQWLDTALVARRAWKQFAKSGYGLATLAQHCGVSFRHHDALEDARAAALVLLQAMDETGLDPDGWFHRVRQPVEPGTDRISREGNQEGPLAGEVVVFTGTLLTMHRTEAAKHAAALGCDVRNSVTSKTTILVVGQQDLAKLGGYTKSTKQRDAETLVAKGADIMILGEEDFLQLGKISEHWVASPK